MATYLFESDVIAFSNSGHIILKLLKTTFNISLFLLIAIELHRLLGGSIGLGYGLVHFNW